MELGVRERLAIVTKTVTRSGEMGPKSILSLLTYCPQYCKKIHIMQLDDDDDDDDDEEEEKDDDDDDDDDDDV